MGGFFRNGLGAKRGHRASKEKARVDVNPDRGNGEKRFQRRPTTSNQSSEGNLAFGFPCQVRKKDEGMGTANDKIEGRRKGGEGDQKKSHLLPSSSRKKGNRGWGTVIRNLWGGWSGGRGGREGKKGTGSQKKSFPFRWWVGFLSLKALRQGGEKARRAKNTRRPKEGDGKYRSTMGGERKDHPGGTPGRHPKMRGTQKEPGRAWRPSHEGS